MNDLLAMTFFFQPCRIYDGGCDNDHSPLDTLRAAKTLKQGGFDETQAETVVNTLDQAVNENLGTKTDLNLLRAEMKQGFTEANAATDKLRSDTKQAFTEANAAVKQGFTEANTATDKLRSDTKQAFTEANAATKQSIADAKTANDKLLAEIDKKFAALYRFLSVFGAALVAIMIALFAAQ